MDEILKISNQFFLSNSGLVIGSVTFSILHSSCEAILLPKFIANVFNNVKDMVKFKKYLIYLIILWMAIKIFYICSNLFRKKIEPTITQFITLLLVQAVFQKYQYENEITNISVLINKIQVIKKTLQEIFYMCFTLFLPRIVVLIVSVITFFFVNKFLSLVIFLSIVVQAIATFYKVDKCVIASYDEFENKDEFYEYLEDIFYNIQTIISISNGIDLETNRLINFSDKVREKEEDAIACITNKQNISYMTNIAVFALIIFTIFILYQKKQIELDQIVVSILILSSLFDNMYEISFYIPELISRIGIIKNNEVFLKNLFKYERNKKFTNNNQNIHISDYAIKLEDVSFQYDKNHQLLNKFSVNIPEQTITCLFGPSGSGKTTFVKLLFGSLSPTEGIVYVDNQNINDFKITEIRKYISYLNQNTTTLFNLTILENLLYGYPVEKHAVLTEQLKYLFEKFRFDTTFSNLNENDDKWFFFNIKVGKLGERLSGGQKQIIHLIRLDLNDISKFVILDEPSSALDRVTRDKALAFIQYLKNDKKKSVVVISHDPEYNAIADTILTFSNNGNPSVNYNPRNNTIGNSTLFTNTSFNVFK